MVATKIDRGTLADGFAIDGGTLADGFAGSNPEARACHSETRLFDAGIGGTRHHGGGWHQLRCRLGYAPYIQSLYVLLSSHGDSRFWSVGSVTVIAGLMESGVSTGEIERSMHILLAWAVCWLNWMAGWFADG